jgi:deazaflavin-dependent oxidoreductase (nitroreductase family)
MLPEGEERKHNPLINSARGARILSALQLPLFALRPPSGYGILTTRGRKSGKARRRCVRAVRRGDKVYLVAIKGRRTGWLLNALADPNVRLRIRGGTFSGLAREPAGPTEAQEASTAYCERCGLFEFLEYRNWRKDRPTREKVEELHRGWFERGTPLIVDLAERS